MSKSNRIELSSITLTTAEGTEVKLTVPEARALHAQLEELFGAKYVPSQPIIIQRDRYPRPWYPYSPHWLGTTTGTTTAPRMAELMCRDALSGLSVRYQGALSAENG